jgi:hypothetical protein
VSQLLAAEEGFITFVVRACRVFRLYCWQMMYFDIIPLEGSTPRSGYSPVRDRPKVGGRIVPWVCILHLASCSASPGEKLQHETNHEWKQKANKTPWPLVRKRTIPTDRPPLVS